MSLTRVYSALNSLIIKKIGDVGGPQSSRVDEELNNIINGFNGALMPWTYGFFVNDPNIGGIGAEIFPWQIVPPGVTEFNVNRIAVRYAAGSHTAGGSVTFALKQRGSAAVNIGSVSLNNTNNTASTLYTNSFADVTLAADDVVTLTITARSGTVSERDVSFFATGTQKLS